MNWDAVLLLSDGEELPTRFRTLRGGGPWTPRKGLRTLSAEELTRRIHSATAALQSEAAEEASARAARHAKAGEGGQATRRRTSQSDTRGANHDARLPPTPQPGTLSTAGAEPQAPETKQTPSRAGAEPVPGADATRWAQQTEEEAAARAALIASVLADVNERSARVSVPAAGPEPHTPTAAPIVNLTGSEEQDSGPPTPGPSVGGEDPVVTVRWLHASPPPQAPNI